ncbi:MAG: Asp-tRNA(Asn)/Glu-tRNA(Gln) amidotransferase subunit GatC [Nitriliruptoraceae bacterium]
MALSPDEVRHVARLARLAIDDAEADALAPMLSGILGDAARVAEVAADDVVPMTHPFDLADITRGDDPVPSLPRDAVLGCAPVVNGQRQVDQDRFMVPRIVAEEG